MRSKYSTLASFEVGIRRIGGYHMVTCTSQGSRQAEPSSMMWRMVDHHTQSGTPRGASKIWRPYNKGGRPSSFKMAPQKVPYFKIFKLEQGLGDPARQLMPQYVRGTVLRKVS